VFRSRATGVMTIVSTPVMLLLAGMLAAELDRNTLMAVSAYSMLWLLSLAIWARVLRDRRAEMVGVATMLLLSAGGAFAAYLNREFAGQAQAFDWPAQGYLGSIVGALTLLETGPTTGTPWAFLGTLFGFGMATLGAFRLGLLRAGKNA
jgi:hypothetical protein